MNKQIHDLFVHGHHSWPEWDSLISNAPHDCKEAKIRSDSLQKKHPVRLEQLCGYFLNLNFSWILKRSVPHYVEESLWPRGCVCSAAVVWPPPLQKISALQRSESSSWSRRVGLTSTWHAVHFGPRRSKKESVNETESLQRIFDLDSRYENSTV